MVEVQKDRYTYKDCLYSDQSTLSGEDFELALQQRLICLYVVCLLVHPGKGPRGRLVCLYVVCLLVHPGKGPRGRLVCLYVVCLLVHPEKGPRGRLVLLSLCSLSPGAS